MYNIYKHIIDGCDEALKDSFVRRMEASVNIAEAKLQSGKPVYEPESERNILLRAGAGLSPELQSKAYSLWKNLQRLGRGRQYRYFIMNDPDLRLPHEEHVTDHAPAGSALCPESIARSVSSVLDLEASPCPSIQSAIDGLLADSGAYAAVELSSFYETDWLYSMILPLPVYIHAILPTADGSLIACLSKSLINTPEKSIITVAFTPDSDAHGSLAQALSVFSDFNINIEYMRLKTPRGGDMSAEPSVTFVEITSRLTSTDTRAALFQLQSELPMCRVLGYRKNL